MQEFANADVLGHALSLMYPSLSSIIVIVALFCQCSDHLVWFLKDGMDQLLVKILELLFFCQQLARTHCSFVRNNYLLVFIKLKLQPT